MAKTYLMLLWHMHQPFYKDLAEDVYAMPWVRLHALKDYYGMVAMLREFPKVHMTFNLVPSLVAQLEDYARGTAREAPFEIAFKPVDQLSEEDRQNLLASVFEMHRENLLNRLQRLKELHEKALAVGSQSAPWRAFSPQEILDLQVLSQLAWFDEVYRTSDADIGGLLAKGRGFSEEDKVILHKKEIEIFNVTLEEYRRAFERGQIEISTSPFYHPILPLLCDTNVAAESRPDVRLPKERFRHPEDARDQLRRAVELIERVFGARPRGLWPSEGSVSDEVLRLAAEEGFEWAATDEGVLARTLQIGFHRQIDGSVWGAQELYRPHRFESEGRGLSLFFRDHQLSDLIGFVYSRMDAREAAADLHNRIRVAAHGSGNQPAVVSIILDGENAWEYFAGNGREFLKSFYARLDADPGLQAVTATEALAVSTPGKLTHIVPGSWINANFDVWIGAEEDNKAWDLLSAARNFFAQNSERQGIDSEKVRLAREEMWVAEGSDWCWWYGPEHSSAYDEEFDRLYRKHLSNIYRLLDGSPPDELAVPIKRPLAKDLISPPTGQIEPRVDGRVSSYFEWLGAGIYTPDYRSGSMHGGAEALEALYYGYNDHALYLRLDFSPALLVQHPRFEIRIKVDAQSQARFQVSVGQGGLGVVQFWVGNEQLLVPLGTGEKVQVAFDRIFELRLDYSLLGLRPGEKARLQVSLWTHELPLQVIPSEGWLTLELTQDLASW
ncbi:MAG TPA: glycoside hydrolase family 57 protein [Terriglobia bacterium]|nr:glycoside hydrolase family 57 protein [Terriglobia bacterium]